MRRLLFVTLLLLALAVVDASTRITTNLVINNYDTIKDGNINGIYGHATAMSSSPPSSTLNITYVVCSPTNPSSINAITEFVLETISSSTIVHNVSACSNPYCSKPANATGCITGLVLYQNTANLTALDSITVLDPIGAVISVFMLDGIEQLNVSPLPPPPEAILAIYHNTTTAPPTTSAPPTTLPPTTLPPIEAIADLTILVGFQDGFFHFSPANPTINISQTVEWVWTSTSIPHTITSGSGGVADGEWCNVPDGVVQNINTCSINNYGHVAPHTWRKTFDSMGTFHYFCLNHPSTMIGSITVIAAPTEAPTTAAPTTPAPTEPPRVLCAPGSRYNDDNTCIECGAGTYQPDVNQTSCIPCATGFIQPDSNSTSCVPCTPGTYQSNNECIPCAAGSVQPDSNATSCVQCQPGEYQSDNQCVVCPPGSTQPDSDSTSCVPCGPGTYQSGNECVTCEPGSIQPDSNTTSCIPCGPGEIQSGDQCVACEPTTYQSGDNHTVCIPCETGSIQPNPSSTSCTICGPGSFQSGDHTWCVDCDFGKYQNLSSSTSCIDCPVDTRSGQGAPECDPCPYFYDTRGNTGSSSCDLSSFAPTLTESQITNIGTDSPDQFTLPGADYIDHFTIKLVRGRTTTPFDVGGSSDTFNIPGNDPSFWTRVEVFAFTIGYVQSNTVIVVSPGRPRNVLSTFDPLTDRTLSITWTDDGCGGTTCNFPTTVTYLVIVNDGTETTQEYTVSSTSLQIPNVLVGTTLTWTVQTVVNGNTMSAKSDVASFTGYDYCAAGSYYTSSGACVACVPGSAQGSANQTSCPQCSAGSFSSSPSSTSCTSCTIGSYQPSAGHTSCTVCPAGSSSPDTSTCTTCSAGSFSASPASTTCTSCTVGSYQSSTGQTSCTTCPAGTQATSPGSTSCTYIPPGAVTNIHNTASQPSVITWTAGSLATDYIFRQNTDPIATTGGLTTSTITSYDPDTWYTINVTSGVNSFGTLGPVASVVIPARPINVVYNFDAVARTINISWTAAPSAPTGGFAGVTYTLFYTGVTYTGISNTYKLITGVPTDANITWSVRTELSGIQFSSNTTTAWTIAYQSAPDAYQQYLFKSNFLDTSYNTFSNVKGGCATLTYSTQTIGAANRDVVSFPYSCPDGTTPAQPVYIASDSGNLPRSYSYSAWVNSNSTNWTLLGGSNSGIPVASWYTFGVNGDTFVTAKMTSYTGTRTLSVSSSPRAFPLNTWVHLAVTYEATTGVLSLYWNSVLQSSSIDSAFINDWKSGLVFRINNGQSASFPYLNGMVSELQVFNVALSPSQLQAVYTSKAKQTVPDPTGCTIKIPASFASVNISTTQAGSGTLYTSGQTVVLPLNVFNYAQYVVCPPGQITSEDTVGFSYNYQCNQVNGLWQFSGIYERQYSSAGADNFRESTWSGAVLPYDVMNVTCITPFTIAMPAPVVQMSFDSGTFTDTSSNVYTTTVQSDVVVTQDSRRGLAASFPSTGATRKYVKINTVTLPKSYTMSAFVYIGSGGIFGGGGTANGILVQGQGLTGVTSTTPNAFSLTNQGTYYPSLQYRQYAGGSALIVNANTIMRTGNRWLHITITYDANTGLLSAFMEGVRQQGTGTIANATDAHRTAWQGGLGIELGTSHATTGTSFVGSIDQFMLFDSVLNDTQIKQNYDQSYMPFVPVNVPVVDPITSPISNSPSNPATLTWVAPANPPANQMIYQVTVNGVVSYIYYGSPSFTIPSYVSTTSYVVSVRSMNKYGTSTTAVSGTIPVAPSSFTSTQTITGNGTLSWSLPASGFTSFVAYLSYNGSSTISSTSILFSGLVTWNSNNPYDGTTVNYKIQTVNGALYSGNATTSVAIIGPPPSNPYAQLILSSSIMDSSENSFGTTVTGSALSFNQAVSGRTATLFSNTQTVSFPSVAVRQLSHSWSMWVNWVSGTAWSLGGPSTNGVYVRSQANTNIQYSITIPSGSGIFVTDSTGGLSANTWTHLGYTFDASTLTFIAYRNGIAVANNIGNTANLVGWTTGSVPSIGGSSATAIYFNGYISEYYFFNYALSPARMKALMTYPSPTYTPTSCKLNLDTTIGSVQVRINSVGATPSTSSGSFVSIPIGTTVYITSPTCASQGFAATEDMTGYNYYYTCSDNAGAGPVFVSLNNRCSGTSGGTGCTSTSTSKAAFASFPVACALPTPVIDAQFNGGYTATPTTLVGTVTPSASQLLSYDVSMGPVLTMNNAGAKQAVAYTLTLPKTFTASFWVRFTGTQPAGTYLIGAPNGPNPKLYNVGGVAGLWYVALVDGTTLRFTHFVTTVNTNYDLVVSYTPTLNTWTRITVTMEQSTVTSGSLKKIYANGVLLGTDEQSYFGSWSYWDAGLPITIGCSGSYYYAPFDSCLNFAGSFKSLQVWNVALPASVISSLYTASTPPAVPDIPYTPYIAVAGPDAKDGLTGAAAYVDFSGNNFQMVPTSGGVAGIIRAAQQPSRFGRSKEALLFQAYNRGMIFANSVMGASYTIAAWFVEMSSAPNQIVTYQGSTGYPLTTNQGFYLGYSQTYRLQCGNYAGGTELQAQSYQTASDAKWYFVVCTYDSTTGIMTLYEDGTLTSQVTAQAAHRTAFVGGLAAQIGREGGASGNYGAVGDMSDLYIYNNVALNQAQVSKLYTQTSA